MPIGQLVIPHTHFTLPLHSPTLSLTLHHTAPHSPSHSPHTTPHSPSHPTTHILREKPLLAPHSLDPDPNGLPEGLCQGLCLTHLKGEHLAARNGCEGRVRAKGLGHCHGDGSLACSWLPGDEHRPSSNLPLLD